MNPSITGSPVDDPPGGAWQLRWEWAFPSLLAVAYAMLFEDVAGGGNIRRCANEPCGRAFVAKRSDNIYCRTQCLNAAHQRKWRREDKVRREQEREAGAGE
jgi:hypothetical protein